MPQTDDKAALAIEAALSALSTEIEQMDPLSGGNRRTGRNGRSLSH
jgi:hypothetical protein